MNYFGLCNRLYATEEIFKELIASISTLQLINYQITT